MHDLGIAERTHVKKLHCVLLLLALATEQSWVECSRASHQLLADPLRQVELLVQLWWRTVHETRSAHGKRPPSPRLARGVTGSLVRHPKPSPKNPSREVRARSGSRAHASADHQTTRRPCFPSLRYRGGG